MQERIKMQEEIGKARKGLDFRKATVPLYRQAYRTVAG